jgi:long-chain acyl-CoA synthetase
MVIARALPCLVIAWLILGTARGAELEGVKFEERVYVAQGVPELMLNGVGVRRKLIIVKVYVAALYLGQKKSTSDAVLSDPGPKRLAMHFLQEEMTAEQLIGALHDGLSANNRPPELAPLEKRLRDLAAMMRQVGKINQGGVIVLDYLPGIGTRITINGIARITIPGEDFHRALMRIWLGDKPVDGRLKDALLGGKDSPLPF